MGKIKIITEDRQEVLVHKRITSVEIGLAGIIRGNYFIDTDSPFVVANNKFIVWLRPQQHGRTTKVFYDGNEINPEKVTVKYFGDSIQHFMEK